MPDHDTPWEVLSGALGELLGDALWLFDGNALRYLLRVQVRKELGEVERELSGDALGQFDIAALGALLMVSDGVALREVLGNTLG